MTNPGREDLTEREWPPAVLAATGTPVTATRLAGAGGPGSFRVEGPRGSIAYKRSVPPRELAFYQRCAPHTAQLAAAGCRTAALVASGPEPEPWLALGWAGRPLPREQWGTASVLAALAAWHRAATLWEGPLDDGYPFAWDDALTRAALDALTASERDAVRDDWGRAAEAARCELFAPPGHAIHGDPNPTNWLVGVDGPESSLVLLDWARPGRAHPAVDVAIALPGLPTDERASQAAQQYLRARQDLRKPDGAAWTRGILLAKLWSAVEFLAMATRGDLSQDAESGVAFLRADLPGWSRRHRVAGRDRS